MGSGRLLAEFARRGWTVNGIDPAPGMIELARARVPVPHQRLAVAQAEALPFPDRAFDVVAAIGVLEYTDMAAALDEMARVVRPGGRAVIGLRSSRAPSVAWQRRVTVPIARHVKRVLPFGRPLPRRRRPPVQLAHVSDLLETFGLSVERVEHLACKVLPDPLDNLALAHRVALLAERSPRLRRLFGTQLVILARKA
jgi:SAM-dependent methyltransferase